DDAVDGELDRVDVHRRAVLEHHAGAEGQVHGRVVGRRPLGRQAGLLAAVGGLVDDRVVDQVRDLAPVAGAVRRHRVEVLRRATGEVGAVAQDRRRVGVAGGRRRGRVGRTARPARSRGGGGGAGRRRGGAAAAVVTAARRDEHGGGGEGDDRDDARPASAGRSV